MRWLGVKVVLGVMVLGAFAYVQPLLTLRVLTEALEDDDVEAIRERMDAERVRQSLREGYVAHLGTDASKSDRSVAAIVSLVLFGRGIEMILATSRPGEGGPAEITEWHYESASRFHATLRQGSGGPITLVLERQGMSWQVVAMEPTEAAWREIGLLQELGLLEQRQ